MVQDDAKQVRFFGFDIVRLLSFVAISFFHISLIHYYRRYVPLSEVSQFAALIEVYARTLAFSGFTILFLTSLLIAYSAKSLSRRLGLFTFLIAGWIIFCLFMGYSYSDFLVWDVYPLIMVGILTATLAEQRGVKVVGALTGVGIVLLCIPFWDFAEIVSMSELWRNVLGFAICDKDVSEWPVLPWIGLVWFGYGCGVALRHGVTAKSRELLVTRAEMLFWVVMLAASTLVWGPYYNIQLGDRFSCEAYRMAPIVFWGHLIWPMFLLRVSVDPRVNAKLGNLALARWVSSLAMSRKFWLAYFLNFIVAHLLSWTMHVAHLMESPYVTEWTVAFAVIFLPLTELATRVVGALLAAAAVKAKTLRQRS